MATQEEQAEAKAREAAEQARRADEAERSTPVRATRVGFYPADGCLRKPGEHFDYVRRKDPATGELETVLPSWMASVDGTMTTRAEFVPSDDKPLVFEVTGKGAAATVKKR